LNAAEAQQEQQAVGAGDAEVGERGAVVRRADRRERRHLLVHPGVLVLEHHVARVEAAHAVGDEVHLRGARLAQRQLDVGAQRARAPADAFGPRYVGVVDRVPVAPQRAADEPVVVPAVLLPVVVHGRLREQDVEAADPVREDDGVGGHGRSPQPARWASTRSRSSSP
jgi:hypothetical protein